jgi:hypothetical protein
MSISLLYLILLFSFWAHANTYNQDKHPLAHMLQRLQRAVTATVIMQQMEKIMARIK